MSDIKKLGLDVVDGHQREHGITGELRRNMTAIGTINEDGSFTFSTIIQESDPALMAIRSDRLDLLCDAIDAVNSNLEAENDRLFEEVQRLERQHQGMTEELERVTAQRDEEAERVDAMATRCMALPADSEKRTVEIGDVMAANATPNEHWRVVGIGDRGLIFLSTGAHINAGVCHHVSEPESIAYAARELESLGTRRGFRNAKEFYEALHQLVTRVVDLCEERDAR